MWKWIAGGVLFLVVLLAGTCYYGYRKFTEGGGATVVMIGATPDRVYASIADPDSLSTWVDVGSTVTSSRHGLLEVGDSFTIVRPPIKAGRAGESARYRVLTVNPGHALEVQLVNDTLTRVARITRHDSLSVANDSTRLSVTYVAETLDSTRISVRDSGKGSSAMLGFAEKMIVAAMRLATEQDLQRLKVRVEKH